jgi:hypothetical protein
MFPFPFSVTLMRYGRTLAAQSKVEDCTARQRAVESDVISIFATQVAVSAVTIFRTKVGTGAQRHEPTIAPRDLN